MSKYKAIVFDLDGTLAESKQKITAEMATLLGKLSQQHLVSVISGGDWPQYSKQLLPVLLDQGIDLSNLLFCPTCATKMYTYGKNGDWNLLYSLDLSSEEKNKICSALDVAIEKTGFKPEQVWGEQIEDRGTQITFSALGQEAPLVEKSKWDPDFSKRKIIKAELDKMLPEYSVRLGGTTSVDITAAGVDKAYGLEQISKHANISIADILFVGDAIFPDGNDYPVVNTGCDFVCVKSTEQTKEIIQELINLD
jgi:phosphomannomutase